MMSALYPAAAVKPLQVLLWKFCCASSSFPAIQHACLIAWRPHRAGRTLVFRCRSIFLHQDNPCSFFFAHKNHTDEESLM
jgi:hypothetical protein